METRLGLIGGKDFIAALSTWCQRTHGFSISIFTLLSDAKPEDISSELKSILVSLDEFCAAPGSSTRLAT